MARNYARELPLNDGIISPVFADLAGLPPHLIVLGEDEVFLHEGQKFVAKAKQSQTQVELLLGQGTCGGDGDGDGQTIPVSSSISRPISIPL